MFIVFNGAVYEITRRTVKRVLRKPLEDKLNVIYTQDMVKDVADEILNNITLSEELDSNNICLINTEKDLEDNLIPMYSEADDIASISLEQYPISDILNMHVGYKKAMLVQVGDTEAFYLISAGKKMEDIFVKVLSSIFSESYAKRFASNIVNDITKNYLFLVKLTLGNIYAVGCDGKYEETHVFDSEELKKAIMKYIPKMSFSSKVLQGNVQKAAFRIHNLFLYEIDESDCELEPYALDKNGEPLFCKTVNGIDFFYDSSKRRWSSEYIKVNTKDFVLKTSRIWDRFNHESYSNPCDASLFYQGFRVLETDAENRPKLKENLPVFTEIYSRYYNHCGYIQYTMYILTAENKSEYVQFTNKEEKPSFDVYIRLEYSEDVSPRETRVKTTFEDTKQDVKMLKKVNEAKLDTAMHITVLDKNK